MTEGKKEEIRSVVWWWVVVCAAATKKRGGKKKIKNFHDLHPMRRTRRREDRDKRAYILKPTTNYIPVSTAATTGRGETLFDIINTALKKTHTINIRHACVCSKMPLLPPNTTTKLPPAIPHH
mmetsp:Transcript_19324/g.30433  ORF Transcript_19324/g.30433 Transcript_19324/m.30433 type:complete len:123 (+) Transcript_19324:70-438(+)